MTDDLGGHAIGHRDREARRAVDVEGVEVGAAVVRLSLNVQAVHEERQTVVVELEAPELPGGAAPHAIGLEHRHQRRAVRLLAVVRLYGMGGDH